MAYKVAPFKVTAEDHTGPALNSVGKRVRGLKKDFDATGAASKKATGNFRAMRGGLGQIGYQVQDIAVQLQSGTNPIIALTQQGSQMASVFGPGGIAVGAIAAVAGSLAVALLPKLFESKDAMKDFGEAGEALGKRLKFKVGGDIDDLSDKIKDLYKQMDTAGVAVSLAAGAEEAGKKVKAAQQIVVGLVGGDANEAWLKQAESVGKTGLAYEDLDRQSITMVNGMYRAVTLNKDLKEAVDNLSKSMGISKEAALKIAVATATVQDEAGRVELRDLVTNTKVLGNEAGDAAQKQDELAEAIRKRIQAGKEEETTKKKAEDEPGADAAAAKLGATMNEHRNAVKTFKTDITEDWRGIATSAKDSMFATGDYLVDLTKLMGSNLNKQSDLAKAAAKVQSGIAIYNIGVSTHEAAMGAYKALASIPYVGPALGAAAAAGIYVTGAAAASSVASQSFEGGGMTGPGSRSGGQDGIGGKYALLHPNEKITDMEKGAAPAPPPPVIFNLSAIDTNGMENMLKNNMGLIVRGVRDAAHARGRSLGGRA